VWWVVAWLVVWVSALVVAPAFGREVDGADGARVEPPASMLIFSRTVGFRHDSIAAGAEALMKIGAGLGLEVEWTQEGAAFTDENLARFGVVVFLSTTGDVLNGAEQGAMERFIRGGRGYVGIHAAADTEYEWAWYQGLVGAAFKSHPATQQATINVVDRTHPATAHLPARWVRTDEWYDYRENPRGRVHVLMTLDETTYEGGQMGHDHPIAWCHHYDGGRAFYTGLGHTRESFAEPAFLEHLRGGIEWAMGTARDEGEGDADVNAGAGSHHDAGGSIWDHYEVVTLDDQTLDPMELSIAADGRVVFVERGGLVKMWEEGRGTRVIGTLSVNAGIEDGLLGVALDPAFMENGWVYIYYTPLGLDGAGRAVNRLSRFTLREIDGAEALDPASEVAMLDVETQREECCHSGGSVAFGPDGLLYLTTGDNTNPFASDGFAPIDEREGRSAWDAQKSSASTDDLRGKILRIRPMPDGTYEIPEGNLFPPETGGGRPEIYVMGCRNPFRLGIDPVRNWVYFGDVGPDSDSASETRGARGHDEWNQVRSAGNYGWPYFVGDNKPYRDHDFATGEPGAWFDASAPVNESPNRRGGRELPPAQGAWVWYPYGASSEFPAMGSGGRCAMGGPTLRMDWMRERYGDATASGRGLPRSMDGVTFMYEWARGKLYAVRTDDVGGLLAIEPFLSDRAFLRPHDLELGPDGCLYLIEWGSEFGGKNTDSKISRIEFYPEGKRPPRVALQATPGDGGLPLKVSFDASKSESRARGSGGSGGAALTVEWDFDGDGVVDRVAPASERVEHTYTSAGTWHATARVNDARTSATVRRVPIHAGNTRPRVRIERPVAGELVRDGAQIAYRVRVEDAEDSKGERGSERGIDPARIEVELVLVRGNVGTVIDRAIGPTGTLTLGPEPEGDPSTTPEIVLRARYTDGGGASEGGRAAEALEGSAETPLYPMRIEAERATQLKNAQREDAPDRAGGQTTALAFIREKSAARFGPLRLDGVGKVRFRVASATRGGTIEVRLGGSGGADGALVGVASVAPTGDWRRWEVIEAPIANPGGVHEVWLVFRGGEGFLFNLDWVEFVKDE
jgi:glucose/arabinose dehydrogenase/type 1 glutamine amidotransferase